MTDRQPSAQQQVGTPFTGTDTPATSTGPAVAPRRAWLVLAVACTTQFMGVLDVTIVNVALPSMRDSLDLSPSGLQWVVNGYTLTFAGFLLLGGRAGDLYGQRRTFLVGLSLFTAASLVGGLAQEGWQLVAARALQGLGGAIVIPVSLSMVTTAYVDQRARARALGVWAAVSGAGGALGSVIGGILTGLLSWRWVLIVNVPIGIAIVAVAWFGWVSAEAGGRPRPTLDVAGAATVTLGTGGLIGAIIGTEQWGLTSVPTCALFALAAVLYAGFLVAERRAADPLVPLGIFRIRAVSLANGLSMISAGVVPATFFFLSIYLQQVRGLEPLQAGLAMVPAAVGIATGSAAASRLHGAVPARAVLLAGSAVSCCSLLVLARVGTDADYVTGIALPLLGAMLGAGMTGLPLTLAAASALPVAQHGLSAGLFNASRQVGGAVGLAALVSLASSRTLSAAGGGTNAPEALTAGFNAAWTVAAGLALVAGLASLALPTTPRPPARSSDGPSDGAAEGLAAVVPPKG